MRTLMNCSAILFFVSSGMWMVDGGYWQAISLAMAGTVTFVVGRMYPVPGRD